MQRRGAGLGMGRDFSVGAGGVVGLFCAGGWGLNTETRRHGEEGRVHRRGAEARRQAIENWFHVVGGAARLDVGGGGEPDAGLGVGAWMARRSS